MRMDEVRQVTTASEGGVATVKIDGADDERRQEIGDALEDLHLRPISTEDHSGGVELIRARDVSGDEEPEEAEDVDDEPITEEVLMIAQSVVVADTTDVPVEVRNELADVVEETLDLDGVANGTVLGEVEIEGDEFEFTPADEFDDGEEVVEVSDVEDEDLLRAFVEHGGHASDSKVGLDVAGTPAATGALRKEDRFESLENRGLIESTDASSAHYRVTEKAIERYGLDEDAAQEAEESVESASETEEADEAPDEDAAAHECACGETFDSPQKLGGHARTCEAAQESRDAAEEAAEAEEGGEDGDGDDAAHECACGRSFDSPQKLGGHAQTCEAAKTDRETAE